MTCARSVVVMSSLWLLLLGVAAPVAAEPFAAGDLLRLGFNLHGFGPPPDIGAFDVFELALGFRRGEPIESFTTRIFDRGKLLGSFTGADPGPGTGIIVSRFKSPTSIYTLDNPTVIDMSSFNDGTFDGSLEFTIRRGRGEVLRVSDELGVGFASRADQAITFGFSATSFEITHGVAPVPEPASVLLLASGAAFIGRCCVRRRQSASTWSND